MHEKIYLLEMTSEEAEEALKKGRKTAIIPVGATEEHGPHRPLGDDSYIAFEFAIRIAEKMNPPAIVSPPLLVGVSHSFMAWHGTMTLTEAVLKEVVKQYVKSLYHHGWNRFIILNSHGGNRAVLQILSGELEREIPEISLMIIPSIFAPFLHNSNFVREELKMDFGEVDYRHGGEFQTSIVMAIEKKYGLKLVYKERAPTPPQLDEYLQKTNTETGKPPYNIGYMPLLSSTVKEYNPSGVFYRTNLNKMASAERGEMFIEVLSKHMAHKIQKQLER